MVQDVVYVLKEWWYEYIDGIVGSAQCKLCIVINWLMSPPSSVTSWVYLNILLSQLKDSYYIMFVCFMCNNLFMFDKKCHSLSCTFQVQSVALFTIALLLKFQHLPYSLFGSQRALLHVRIIKQERQKYTTLCLKQIDAFLHLYRTGSTATKWAVISNILGALKRLATYNREAASVQYHLITLPTYLQAH